MIDALGKGAPNVLAITELLQNKYNRDDTSDGTLSDDHEDGLERMLDFDD